MKKTIAILLISLMLFTSGCAVMTAAAPEPTPAPDTVVESTYVASRKAKKYHRTSCQYAAKIKDENLVSFDSAAQAQAAGYAPCGACKP